jgi:hypothetical protein
MVNGSVGIVQTKQNANGTLIIGLFDSSVGLDYLNYPSSAASADHSQLIRGV